MTPDHPIIRHDEHPYDHYNYFSNPTYYQPDYHKPYTRKLPGADFNKHVYEFHDDSNIFDQNEYEKRIEVEATLMIALEGLKANVMQLQVEVM